jgi:hypothetical protein
MKAKTCRPGRQYYLLRYKTRREIRRHENFDPGSEIFGKMSISLFHRDIVFYQIIALEYVATISLNIDLQSTRRAEGVHGQLTSPLTSKNLRAT